jgi:hypothetical protein
MSDTSIPIPETTLRRLEELAEWYGLSLAEALERAVKEQHDRQFWAAVNAGYAALRADPEAWTEELAERRLWEATLMDGLDPEDAWTEKGEDAPPVGRDESK